MATVSGESPGENPDRIPSEGKIYESSGFVDDYTHGMDYALQQAQIAQKTVQSSIDTAIETTRSRLDLIRTTSDARFHLTLDSLQGIKSECSAYEDIVFGKIKEGFLLAGSHPWMATGAFIGLGFLGLKRTRQFVHYGSMRLVFSEEALLSRADAKVKELRQSMDLLKAEAEKLEQKTLQSEEDFVRGRTKLRQAGKQIQSSINSAYKIERQARGLKDVLRDLPSREASRFLTRLTNLSKEAKRERNVLSKEVTKISNHGISV